jgi:prolipoprotein diacylglyceryltransferase
MDSPAGSYQHQMHAHGLIPSQLIESGGGLVIMIVILLVGMKKTFPGFQFYLMGIMYAILRFFVDFTRFYTPQEKLGQLSHNQIVCIAFFILFAGLILKNIMFKEEKQQEPGQPPATA